MRARILELRRWLEDQDFLNRSLPLIDSLFHLRPEILLGELREMLTLGIFLEGPATNLGLILLELVLALLRHLQVPRLLGLEPTIFVNLALDVVTPLAEVSRRHAIQVQVLDAPTVRPELAVVQRPRCLAFLLQNWFAPHLHGQVPRIQLEELAILRTLNLGAPPSHSTPIDILAVVFALAVANPFPIRKWIEADHLVEDTTGARPLEGLINQTTGLLAPGPSAQDLYFFAVTRLAIH
mmetsp:Transcript_47640/g.120096  ORF Transcript_47640/g.120096 Transcript_47640/m.120096 type:complete len:238 (-) Transcript_47640:991-1704(-)